MDTPKVIIKVEVQMFCWPRKPRQMKPQSLTWVVSGLSFADSVVISLIIYMI